jgi:hypothetical protein
MKNKIEQRIKGDICEWIETDGLMETLKIKFADTDVTCFVREYVDDMLDDMLDVDPEEAAAFCAEMVKVGMKHAHKIFHEVMADLRLVEDTMLAGIDRALAVQNQKEGI